MRIYVASSWRSEHHDAVVKALRGFNWEVYDYRQEGFKWDKIDPNWKSWTVQQYTEALQHPAALEGYQRDIFALSNCDACVLVLPCGRSASWEAGFAMGQEKLCFVYVKDAIEPELMFHDAIFCTSKTELCAKVAAFQREWRGSASRAFPAPHPWETK